MTVTLLEKTLMVAIVIVCILFGVDKCNSKSYTNQLIHNRDTYKDTAMYFQDKYHHEVVFNKALTVESSKQISDLLSSNKELQSEVESFKSVVSVAQAKTITKIIHDTILFPTGLKLPDLEFKPFTITKNEAFFKIVETIHMNFVTIDTISMPNTQSIITGVKKTGLFKSEMRVEILNSNPYVHTTGITSYVVQNPPKMWYERPLITGIMGIGLGYIGGRFSK